MSYAEEEEYGRPEDDRREESGNDYVSEDEESMCWSTSAQSREMIMPWPFPPALALAIQIGPPFASFPSPLARRNSASCAARRLSRSSAAAAAALFCCIMNPFLRALGLAFSPEGPECVREHLNTP